MTQALLRRLLHERFRQFSTYILFLLFFSLSLTSFLLAYHKGGPLYKSLNAGMNDVHVNAPFIVYYLTATVFQFCILITAYFFGRQGLRDFQQNTYQFVFAAPVKKSTYISAHLIAETVRMLFIYSGIGLGAWMAASFHSNSPITAHVPGSILLPYLTNIIPNLLLFGSLSYLLTLYTRKIYPVYVITAASVILKIFTGITTRLESSVASLFLDPFGIAALNSVLKTWSVTEKNTLLIALQNEIVINRIFWLLITGVFAYVILKKIKLACIDTFSQKTSTSAIIHFTSVESKKDFSLSAFWYSVVRIAWQDFISLCKNRFFIMIVSLAVLMLLIVGFQYVGIVRNTQTYPVTYEMLKISENIFLLFVFMIIAFTSAESVWRDRDIKTSNIIDSLPVNNTAWMLGKITSVSLVVFSLMSVIMIMGIIIQTLHGYFRYDFGQYVTTLFVIRWVQFSLIAVMSVTLQVLAPKKYIGYIMVILFFAMQDVAYDLISQHNLAGFANIIPIVHSDMNGFDVYLKRALMFNGYWTGVAVLIVILGIGFWKNGYAFTLRDRIYSFATRMNNYVAIGAVVGITFIAAFGSTAYYTTTHTNTFISDKQFDRQSAEYEIKYKSYDSALHPKVTAVVIQAELYPSKRFCKINGILSLENKTEQPLSEIYLEIPEGAKNVSIILSSSAQLLIDDTTYGIRLYRLTTPLLPHDKLTVDCTLTRDNYGIENEGSDRDIIPNGSFLYYKDIIPGIGYDANRTKEITDPQKRIEFGLSPRKEYSNSTDIARSQAMISKDGDYVALEITVSTEAEQTALAPGFCKKQWNENGRVYATYSSDVLVLKYFAILSGRYAVAKDSWGSIPIEIYYHPNHSYNIDIMIKSAKDTLAYCTSNFSPYPYKKIQIIEFPRYQIYAEAFPGMIPISEGFGFIARFKPNTVEYAYRTIAHEIGHQWWAHIVTSAFYPGHQMLTEMAAQYTAVTMMKKHYSLQAFDTVIRNSVKEYFKGRRHATEYEPPMLKTVPEHPYVHYDKAIVIMNALQEYIGEENCTKAYRNYCTKFASTAPPFALSSDLYDEFKKVTPNEYAYLLNEWFATVTLYSVVAKNASYDVIDDNHYLVTISYSLEKVSLLETGESTRLETDTHVQISIYDNNGKEYKMIKLLKNNTGTIEIPVDFKPESAGLNTHYLLIEKDYNDNTVKCIKSDKNIPI